MVTIGGDVGLAVLWAAGLLGGAHCPRNVALAAMEFPPLSPGLRLVDVSLPRANVPIYRPLG